MAAMTFTVQTRADGTWRTEVTEEVGFNGTAKALADDIAAGILADRGHLSTPFPCMSDWNGRGPFRVLAWQGGPDGTPQGVSEHD